MTEDDIPEKAKEDIKMKKVIGRGESGDSQMSSWSGSSLPSTKKNVSGNYLHEDDNVFVNFHEKIIDVPKSVKLQTQKISNAFDFDLSKLQIAEHPSTDDGSRFKSKPRISSNDMRDYFDDSAPEFATHDEEYSSTKLLHVLQSNQPTENEVLTSKNGNPLHQENTNLPINISSKDNPIVNSRDVAKPQNIQYPGPSLNTNNNNTNNQKTSDRTQELRRRFSLDRKKRERSILNKVPVLDSQATFTYLQNKLPPGEKLILRQPDEISTSTYRSETTVHVSKCDESNESKPQQPDNFNDAQVGKIFA